MKKKISLKSLEVKSFVTMVDSKTVKGGQETLNPLKCGEILTIDRCLTGMYPTLNSPC